MQRSPQALYLDLLKKTLTYTLWPEPAVPLIMFNDQRSPLRRAIVAALSRSFAMVRIGLVRQRDVLQQEREEGRIWPACADTMIGLRRLENLQQCIESVLRDGVAGDLIEAGVWRGGACIFMRGVLAAYGVGDRRVYVADSFAGCPAPDSISYPPDAGDSHHKYRILAVPEQEVRRNFERYGLLDEQVVFLPGWFKDSLNDPRIQTLAVLRLDGDMYGSTIEAIRALYPRLSPGGFCIVDDYGLPGCQKAIDDYRRENGIDAQLIKIDFVSRYWRKPLDAMVRKESVGN